jgi:UDP-hydrolysing UDP-N-acetyl-D-glucosamine 2-epimerase
MEKIGSKKKSIAVVTGARSDFGILRSVIDAVQNDSCLKSSLIVAGSHASEKFGNTYTDIVKYGYHIDAVIDMSIEKDAPEAVVRSMGKGLQDFSTVLEDLKPDLIVILGDRYEALIAAQAALIFKIPIAHIHGGEVTQGAVDDSIRHAITKMASIHFVANEEYRYRVIQMGEDAGSVFNIGAPGLDQIDKNLFWSKGDLSADLSLKIGEHLFVVTYHPETLAENGAINVLDNIFSAINFFKSASVIFTYPGSDVGSWEIINKLENFCNSNRHKYHLSKSLGMMRYLSAMKIADAVIGNSSSGIIEAPYIGTPTVNIGDRQSGRLKANSVFDVTGDSVEGLITAITQAINFKKDNIKINQKYKGGDVGLKIKNILKDHKISLAKKFMDYKYEL